MSRTSPVPPTRILSGTLVASVAAAVLLAGARISGQAPTQTMSPFDMVGFIQKATLDNPQDVLSGGTMTINGHVVTVPRNTILQMPAASMTWQEVFALAPAPYGLKGNGQSGLALTDSPAPLATYEVHVQGNRIVDASGDRYIAGLLFIAQQSLNVGQGYINYIDYARGEMRVGGQLHDPTTGARVRLNDPLGKFSKGDPNADVRFTVDEDNPTVRTETGYPLCLPRSNPFAVGSTPGVDDQYCPQRNRPQSTPGIFDQVVGGNPLWFSPNNLTGPDSMLPAPFEVGDYVAYSGVLVADPAGPNGPHAGPYPSSLDGTYISANTITANLGFYTEPGTTPVYVAIDVMLMGTGGLNTTVSPQEATLRTRVEGFTTDPFGAFFSGAIVGGGGGLLGGGGGGIKSNGTGTTIDIAALDVDCTGTTTDRPWVYGVAADPGVFFGGAKAGRWRFLPTGGSYLPPPRSLRASISDGRRLRTANLPNGMGLETGQYNAPIFEYIFPENLVIGGPTVGMNFNDFGFLANGSGNYSGPSGGSGVVGQLSPWPGSPAPAVSCGVGSGGTGVLLNPPEVTIAGPSFVTAGTTVTLSATGTDLNVPQQNPVTLSWRGPAGITLSTPTTTITTTNTTSAVTFKAPTVSQLTVYTFFVTAANSAGLAATTPITVDVGPAPVLTVGSGGTAAPALTVTASVGATSNTPGSGTLLQLPYTVGYGATVQIVAKSTAAKATNGVTITWGMPPAQPNSTALTIPKPVSTTASGTTTSVTTFSVSWVNLLTGGPGLVAGSAPALLPFTITSKDNKTGATQTQSVTLVVVPPPDTLTALVTYVTGLLGGGKGSKLVVQATTNAPLNWDPNTLEVLSPRFTLTFDVTDPFDPRFGQHVVWSSWAMNLGQPTATVLGYGMPLYVTVTSSAGGSITVDQTNFIVK